MRPTGLSSSSSSVFVEQQPVPNGATMDEPVDSTYTQSAGHPIKPYYPNMGGKVLNILGLLVTLLPVPIYFSSITVFQLNVHKNVG